MDGGIFQPAMLVSWMAKMLKTWHEARRLCGEWSCFHVFSCVHFHFRCIQIGFISRIYLTNYPGCFNTRRIAFQQTARPFSPAVVPCRSGWFPHELCFKKNSFLNSDDDVASFPIPKKDGLASVVQNVSSLYESSGVICSASHLLCLFVWMQLFTCKAGCKLSRFKRFRIS